MATPSPTYRKADAGNYNGSGTAAHAHRSFTLDGAGYDLSAAPDGTLVVIWCPLGHEHNDILLEDPDRNTHIYTGSVADYSGDPTTLTEVTGWSEGPWQAVAPSSVIIIHGHAIYGTLGDGTGGTIDKSAFTEKTSGNSDITIAFSESGGSPVYPQTDSWVTPIINVFEPNAGNNAVVDAATVAGTSGAGDPATMTIPTVTTGQDETYLMLFGESIADAWDSGDPTGWTGETSADGGWAREWNRDVATASTVTGVTHGVNNGGQPDGYAANIIGVYYDTGGGGGGPTTTPDVKIQNGTADITAATTVIPLGSAVSSLDSAFAILANSRHQGGGTNGSSANLSANDMGVRIELTAVDEITVTYDAGNSPTGTRIAWQVWEYLGPSGGANEFIVRSRNEFAFTTNANQTTALDTTPTDVDDVIPFITGITSTDAGSGANCLSGRAWLDGTTGDLTVAAEPDGFTTDVSVVCVEFVGANWTVGHGFLNGGTVDSGTVSLNFASDGSGATYTADWTQAFIASWGYVGDTVNQAISDNWPRLEPSNPTGSSSVVDYVFHSNHDGTDDDLVVHVLENPNVSVTHFSDSQNAANESTFDISSAGLSDLSMSAILGTAISSGGGTAYGRGWRNYYLNSLTEAATWCHRSGNTVTNRVQIIDMSALETTTSGGTTNIAVGSTTALKVYVGTVEVGKVYVGSTLVWEP